VTFTVDLPASLVPNPGHHLRVLCRPTQTRLLMVHLRLLTNHYLLANAESTALRAGPPSQAASS